MTTELIEQLPIFAFDSGRMDPVDVNAVMDWGTAGAGAAMLARRWGSIVVTPSSSGVRLGKVHPLESLLKKTSLKEQLADPCLARSSAEVGEREASDNRYKTTRSVKGDQVLIVDDAWITGSSVLSAASRLSLDGATVVGSVIVGRQIDPTWRDDNNYWEMVTAKPFRFASCCLAEPRHIDE